MRVRVFHAMRWRLATTMIVVLLGMGLIIGIVMTRLVQTHYRQTLEQGLAGQAHLIATVLQTSTTDLDRQVDAWHAQLQARVTIVAPDGRVLADSPQLAAIGSDLRYRSEVNEALQYGQASASHFHVAIGEELFYVAVWAPQAPTIGVVRIGVPLTQVVEAQRAIAQTVAFTTLGAVALAVVAALLLARHMTRPIRDLRTMATRMAAGELDVAVPLPSDADLAALAHDFNQMAVQIRMLITSRERERQQLATILMQMADGLLLINADDLVLNLNPAAERWLPDDSPVVPFPMALLPFHAALVSAVALVRTLPRDEQPVVIDELRLAGPHVSLRAVVTSLPPPDTRDVLVLLQDLSEVRRIEQRRRTLLAHISHDFRTPLASMSAMVETLLDGALDEPVVARDFLRRMDAEVQSLSRLVTEFLELSRLDAGQVTLHRAPTDLRRLLLAVAERMEAQAQIQQVTIAVSLARGLPAIWIDPLRMEQVLLNLLQNALAWTPMDGTVTLEASLSPRTLWIVVSDTGAGIAADDVPHIFEEFYKTDPARSHPPAGPRGSGLGLAIVRHLVTLHGGTVSAVSERGAGTTLTIALPRVTLHVPAACSQDGLVA